MPSPTRPALRYYGGKWRIAPWIISFFPPHTCYVEPYAGAASVLMRKQPAEFEVLNDTNHELINFFDIIRERPDEFMRSIQLTPYSREEYARSQELSADPLERARRFYVRCWQSFGSGGGSRNNGWRFQHSDNSRARVVREFNDIEHLSAIVWRLKHVQIDCDDAINVIQRFDQRDTLFYVDPPYLHSVRHETSAGNYDGEMSEDDHAQLAEVLHQVRGMVVLSGYDSEMYRDLYAGWEVVSKDARVNGGRKRTEMLWLSPSIREKRLPLLAYMEDNNADHQ